MTKGLAIAVELLIEKWHEIEAEPEPTDYQIGYQAACAVIMAAVVSKIKTSKKLEDLDK